jgi:colanic acid/amylovoran biosynthesis glycosyltransferase
VTSTTGDKEGIPTILVEAQATGLPVVSTWHAGVPEVVVDGKTGFLVKERDANELAVRLLCLIDHPEDWSKLGSAGREHVSGHFDVMVLARELEEIYERALA